MLQRSRNFPKFQIDAKCPKILQKAKYNTKIIDKVEKYALVGKSFKMLKMSKNTAKFNNSEKARKSRKSCKFSKIM